MTLYSGHIIYAHRTTTSRHRTTLHRISYTPHLASFHHIWHSVIAPNSTSHYHVSHNIPHHTSVHHHFLHLATCYISHKSPSPVRIKNTHAHHMRAHGWRTHTSIGRAVASIHYYDNIAPFCPKIIFKVAGITCINEHTQLLYQKLSTDISWVENSVRGGRFSVWL